MATITGGIYPTFQQVYDCLKKRGPAKVTSSRGSPYEVYAECRKNQPVIVGYPRKGEVKIHKDCWGQDITCQGTRAGGIFNGNPSIYDWYNKYCQHAVGGQEAAHGLRKDLS